MEGYEASTYGDRFADVYDDWYGDVTDVVACTRHLATLAASRGGGPVLELGVGTGRLAIPLARLGVEVHGIDASAAMVERLRAKPGGDAIAVSIGDMADLDLPDAPPFSVVFVAFNTFFNLPTEAAQRRCLERVALLLAPDGVLVLEAFVPRDDIDADAEAGVSTRHITADEVVRHRESGRRGVADHHRSARARAGERRPAAAVAPPLRHAGSARRAGCGRRPRPRDALGGLGRRAVHRRERRPRLDVPPG